MAAGTAAALVPIRSITRRIAPTLPQDHPRVSVKEGEETITYIPDNIEEPGPLCTKLLAQLKGIQLGKLEDSFGWRFEVTEEDGKRVLNNGNISA
jgi:hypothetical protein